MTLVIATGGIDLSVGSVMAISGALAPLIFQRDIPLAVALAFVLPVLATGQSGNPHSRHWGDLLPAWRDGRTVSLGRAAPDDGGDRGGRFRLLPP